MQEGDLVLLSTKKLEIRGATKKLKLRFIGPYQVLRIRGIAATLELPQELAGLHPTFH